MKRIHPTVLALAAATCLGAIACEQERAAPTQTMPTTAPAEANAPAAPIAIATSIYPLEVALRDQDGVAIGADVFRGHPVIVSMFYGSCPAACPLIISQIKQVEASLSPEVRAETRVLLVSFDAERDTPAALRKIGKDHHVDTSRWRFASGSDDQARVLANALGVVYRKHEGGVFSHNSVITVLDGVGRIVARVDDPRAELAPLARAIRQSDI